MWYIGAMTAKALRDVLRRVEAWPEEAQEELAAIAREIDAQLAGGVYHATASCTFVTHRVGSGRGSGEEGAEVSAS
jgi:hypothetical protein